MSWSDTMAQLAESPTPVSSFRWNKVQEQIMNYIRVKRQKIFSHCIFHFQWHLLSFGKPEPWSKPSRHCIRLHCSLRLWSGIATIWSCIASIWSGIFCNLNAFMSKTWRPWTMWRATRWWWPRPGSCLTSSWGRSSPTSSGSPACTSWRSVDQNTYCWERLPRLHIYHEARDSYFFSRIAFSPLVWLMLFKRTRPIQRGSDYMPFN